MTFKIFNYSLKVIFIIFTLLMPACGISQDLNLKSDYCFVVNDKVNVRSQPHINANVVKQLRLADRVLLLKRSGKKAVVGDKSGEWVYIDTQYFIPRTSITLKGWVFGPYIAGYSMFKRISKFKPCIFKGAVGDYILNIEFDDRGKYKRLASERKNQIRMYTNGSLYQYQKVIIAKDDDTETYNYFYLGGKGQLCYASRDLQGNSICVKCDE